jgi:hypothetical protein
VLSYYGVLLLHCRISFFSLLCWYSSVLLCCGTALLPGMKREEREGVTFFLDDACCWDVTLYLLGYGT